MEFSYTTGRNVSGAMAVEDSLAISSKVSVYLAYDSAAPYLLAREKLKHMLLQRCVQESAEQLPWQ